MPLKNAELIRLLEQLVRIPSVSSDPKFKTACLECARFLCTKLESLGGISKLVETRDGKNPIVLGRFGQDPKKPTITLYNHYDVQPASKEDGWENDPFTLVEREGYLYGRGVTDDKGPIVALLTAIQEILQEKSSPVNLVVVFEGEEESGSGGFEEAIREHREWFQGTDCVLITDNHWLGEDTPCLTYGLRGITYMTIEVKGPSQDLHSGEQGGVLHEPMQDLVALLNSLSRVDGTVAIPGFYDSVEPLTPDEEALYKDIQVDLVHYKKSLGVECLRPSTPKDLLLRRWRYPCLSIHGIEGAFSGSGAKTVIPGRVVGKVSMRTVPDQDPLKVGELFKTHIENEFQKLKSCNHLSVKTFHAGDWWLGNPNNCFFKAASHAIKATWLQSPIYTREGGSIPVTPFLEKTLNAPAVLIAVGQSTDRAHSQNERIRVLNLTNAKDVLKRFFVLVAKQKDEKGFTP